MRRCFERELGERFARANQDGLSSILVNAGDVHRSVGGYPNGGNHQMPVCCAVMPAARNHDDVVLAGPPSGKGASLTIAYKLPR